MQYGPWTAAGARRQYFDRYRPTVGDVVFDWEDSTPEWTWAATGTITDQAPVRYSRAMPSIDFKDGVYRLASERVTR